MLQIYRDKHKHAGLQAEFAWICTVVGLWRSETSDPLLPQHCSRLLLTYSHHNEQRENWVNLRLTGRGLQGKRAAAFDHHECWVRQRPLGSHCSDLPGGKQGCQFDSSLAFSKVIRYRVYTGIPAGASVLDLLRAWSVAQSHPARIISFFFHFCSVWFAWKKSCIYPG